VAVARFRHRVGPLAFSHCSKERFVLRKDDVEIPDEVSNTIPGPKIT